MFDIYIYDYIYTISLHSYCDVQSSPQIADLRLRICVHHQRLVCFSMSFLFQHHFWFFTWPTEVWVIHVNPCCCFIMFHLCLALQDIRRSFWSAWQSGSLDFDTLADVSSEKDCTGELLFFDLFGNPEHRKSTARGCYSLFRLA